MREESNGKPISSLEQPTAEDSTPGSYSLRWCGEVCVCDSLNVVEIDR